MKIRIISAAVAIAIAVTAMCFLFGLPFLMFIAVLCTIAANEIMDVAGVKSWLIKIPGMVFAAAIPSFVNSQDAIESKLGFEVPVATIIGLYVLIMLSLMLVKHKQIKFDQLAVTLYGSIFVPYALSNVLIIKDSYKLYETVYNKGECVYLVLFALFCALITDSFAYFVGRKFGKHKLCPNISPKKTIEGAVGGLVLSVAYNVAVFAGVRHWIFHDETEITFTFIIVMSFVLSAVSMLGDLSASLLKRNFGVKDFGKIMPGHGGVVDRLDSCIFVFPVLVAALKFVNIVG